MTLPVPTSPASIPHTTNRNGPVQVPWSQWLGAVVIVVVVAVEGCGGAGTGTGERRRRKSRDGGSGGFPRHSKDGFDGTSHQRVSALKIGAFQKSFVRMLPEKKQGRENQKTQQQEMFWVSEGMKKKLQ